MRERTLVIPPTQSGISVMTNAVGAELTRHVMCHRKGLGSSDIKKVFLKINV